MTVRMMRCTVPHHRLDTGAYVPEGTLLMENDANVIPAFYVLVEYEQPVAPAATKTKRSSV
jgi:hypothetical protein